MNFDFSKDYVLENNRVRIEPLNLKHVMPLQKIGSDKEIWTYFLGKSNGNNRILPYVEEAIEQRNAGKEYAFAVYDKLNKCYAGCTRLFDFSLDLNVVRMGYSWFGRDFRGKKINKNTKYLLFQFVFEEIKVERIGLGAHSENIVSLAAMKSIGCLHEGTLRNLFPSIHNSGRADAELYGLLHQEWHGTVKNNLKEKL